ncbi:carboxymuconolactone decarboxylase family protein [Thermus sp.]|jgi:4-carboxymuconolactone decarboxylase|uniref:carboxymuconolactone decarboxylase family protein n=1 Tax=Thermus sp. TaxID=275 RepID=UPI00321F692F
MSVREALWGEKREAIEEALKEADEDLFRYIRDFAYEEVLARPGLDLKTRELLAITALIALGSPKELATHLEGALRVGATEREVRETILQAALFLGFPRALAAMKLFQKVLKGRGAPHEGEG